MRTSAPPPHIPPARALHEHTWTLIDVRPAWERYGGLGFIPGSLHAPPRDNLLDLTPVQDLLELSQGVLLVCLSGSRAAALAARAPRWDGRPVGVLEGGLLAWQQARLPICGLPNPTSTPFALSTLEGLHRQLLACFAAELTEATLDDAQLDGLNPRQLLDGCFTREGVDPARPDLRRIVRVFDRLAWLSRANGAPLEHIRNNLDGALAALERLGVTPVQP